MKLKLLIYSRKPIIFIMLIFENIYNDLSIMLISFDIFLLSIFVSYCFILQHVYWSPRLRQQVDNRRTTLHMTLYFFLQ